MKIPGRNVPANRTGTAPPDASVRRGGHLSKHANIFVIGDLIIDHTVFVTSAQAGQLEPVTGEAAFQVQRRLDTAGGAATAARTISLSSEGTTFLWGLLGTSQWGTFRSILENSQALDGAEHPIELRGTQDETDAPMSTVSRLVLVQHTPAAQERYVRKSRFVDSGKLHVPLSKFNDVTYHLKLAHATHLDSIVLDDLSAGALNTELVSEISTLASDLNIPLIVRARRNAEKYSGVRAKALVCTLAEWTHLVQSNHEPEYWKSNIRRRVVANELARLSIFAFPLVDYHVILVGDNWIDSIVTVEAAAVGDPISRVVLRPGVPADEKGKSHQVGTSDVFTGAFALQLSDANAAVATLNSAISHAAQIAAQYQRMSWNRIPNANGSRSSELRKETTGEGPFGTRYLPRTDTIEMKRAKTGVPSILSVTKEMLDSLERLQKDVETGWDEAQSMILVASGGSGKTAIGDQLITSARSEGHEALWFSALNVPWNWSDPAAIIAAVRTIAPATGKKVLVAVDEVLKLRGARAIATKGVILLNEAKEAGIRFLFIDADFAKARIDGWRSQFGRRCTIHVLPSAWERGHDFPYVIGNCLARGFADGPPKVNIQAAAMVAIIEWMLRGKRNFGELDKLCKQITKSHADCDSMSVTWEQLPPAVRGDARPLEGWKLEWYRVTYD